MHAETHSCSLRVSTRAATLAPAAWRCAALACLLFIKQAAVAPGPLRGADITWGNFTGETNWNSGASWVGGVVPTSDFTTDRAVFGIASAINAFPTVNG